MAAIVAAISSGSVIAKTTDIKSSGHEQRENHRRNGQQKKIKASGMGYAAARIKRHRVSACAKIAQRVYLVNILRRASWHAGIALFW